MKLKHSALYIVHCALCIVLWCAGAFTAQRAGESLGGVAARWPNGGVSPAQLEAQLEIFREDGTRDVPSLTLWTRHASQNVTDGGEKSLRAPVLELYGPAENLRADRYLSGSAPAKGSTKTCAVSEGAAFALWGGANVTGQALVWNNQDYTVQGVFGGEDALVLVQALGDSKTLFADMQLCFAGNGGRQTAEEFLARTDFGSPQLLDMPLLGWALELAAFLPAILIGLWLLARLLVHGLRLRKNPRKLLYYVPAALGVTALDILLLTRVRRVPDALIPSRWSDFDYWRTLSGNIASRIETWLSDPQASDIALLFAALGAAVSVFASLLAMSVLLSKARLEKPLHALLACLGCVLLVFLMAAYYAGRGGLEVNLAMWLMPCLWILADYGLSWWKEGAAIETKP